MSCNSVQWNIFHHPTHNIWSDAPIYTMAIQIVEFSSGGYKIRKIFALESTYPKEIIEFWINDELSKIGHQFSNKVI